MNPKNFSRQKRRQPRRLRPRGANGAGMPDTFAVTLKALVYATPNTGTSFVKKIGLLEPLGISVGYLDQMMTMYSHGRITRSQLTITAINLAAEPVRVAVGVAPHNWTLSHDDLILRKHSKNTIISGKGGLDKWTATTAVSSSQVLGKQYMLADFDFDLTQITSTVPLVDDEPCWFVNLEATGAALDSSLCIQIEYRVELYCLEPSM